MTESEWLACTNPHTMLEFLRDKASVRKVHLLVAATCAHVFRRMVREEARRGDYQSSFEGPVRKWFDNFLRPCEEVERGGMDLMMAMGLRDREWNPALIRETFGPLLFRPVAVAPSVLAWRDRTVPKLAQSIYDERAYDHLPALADALEEAGCADADLLGHLRSPGPHVRGCWALDLLLAKE